jgi:hypothetical protein
MAKTDKTLGLSEEIVLPYYYGQKRAQLNDISSTSYLSPTSKPPSPQPSNTTNNVQRRIQQNKPRRHHRRTPAQTLITQASTQTRALPQTRRRRRKRTHNSNVRWPRCRSPRQLLRDTVSSIHVTIANAVNFANEPQSRDGDLASGDFAEASVLHRFAVPQVACNGHAFSLEHSLDLGVGGDGIIGRRVSFVNHQTVLGEGIIGWN